VLAPSGQIPASEAMPESRSEAQKALSLDPLLPEAHGMLGIVAAEFTTIGMRLEVTLKSTIRKTIGPFQP